MASNNYTYPIPLNLFKYSEEIDSSIWVKSGVSVIPNAIAAPDGTFTADKIVETKLTSAGNHFINQTLDSVIVPGSTYSISIYGKGGGTARYLQFAGLGLAGTTEAPIFDLDNGTVGLPTTSQWCKSATITVSADGWYHCKATILARNNQIPHFYLTTAFVNTSSDASVQYTGDGTSFIHLWGAQITVDSPNYGYAKTTSTAITQQNFDYDVPGVKIQTIASKQLPEFIREDHEAFTTFIKAYYEYMDKVDGRNIEQLRSIDDTIDEYLTYFRNEIGHSTPININMDARLFLRKSKQAFISKGTPESYKLLFRLMFGKSVEISYPWDSVLKASDGKWKQDTSMFISITSGDINVITGNQLVILGENTRIKVSVERIAAVTNTVYEVFINKNFYGNIVVGSIASYGEFSGVILPTVSGYKIETTGTGFKQGDLITETTTVGSATTSITIKVLKVNSSGGITKIGIIKFGYGYQSEFFLNKSKASTTITLTGKSTFNVNQAGTDIFGGPLINDTEVSSYYEAGSIIEPNYWASGLTDAASYSDLTYAGQLLVPFSGTTTNTIAGATTTNPALIRFTIGAIAKYQGYFSTNDGFLNDSIVIQDSKYYQKYSYLVSIDERLEDFKSIVNSYIHPAGTVLFGEYRIQVNYTPTITSSIEVSIT